VTSLVRRGAPHISPKAVPWEYTGLRILALGPDGMHEMRTLEDEVIALPLRGGWQVGVDGEVFDLAGRTGVFDAVSDFAYAPRDSTLTVATRSGGEIALGTAHARRRLDPYRVAAEDVAVEVRGGGVGTRQINNYLGADRHEADRLICVEVLTPSGNWSSYPPHKHDEFSGREVPLEEIYYFRFDRPGGFGVFSVYTNDGDIDLTERVGHGDVVLVPRGYHGPAAPAPGYAMYYLNVMAGPAEQRAWRFTDDPDHAWVRDALAAMEPDPRLPMTGA
jgi:5-deoxy-glucuronate isomerase